MTRKLFLNNKINLRYFLLSILLGLILILGFYYFFLNLPSNPVKSIKQIPEEEIRSILGESLGNGEDDNRDEGKKDSETVETGGGSQEPVAETQNSKPDTKLTQGDYTSYIKKLSLNKINKNFTAEEFKNHVKTSIDSNKYNKNFSQAFITPDGGVLEIGDFSLVFPKNAVKEPVIVTFKNLDKSTSNPDSRDKNLLGKVFELTAYNLEYKEVTKFEKDLVINFKNIKKESKDKPLTFAYLNEESKRWELVNGSFENENYIAKTNHFSLYTLAAVAKANQIDTDPDVFLSCTNLVDNGDVSPCYEGLGNWSGQAIGYGNTSDFTVESNNYIGIWTPNLEDLEGELEVQISVPPIQNENQELTSDAIYYVYDGTDLHQLVVDLGSHTGESISLGTYNFEHKGFVALADDFYPSGPFGGNSGDQYVIADAVCFGNCDDAVGGGGFGNMDLVPPTIENVIAQTVKDNFIVQADITDNSGTISQAFVFANGQNYPMVAEGSKYSVKIPLSEDKIENYYIIAYDGAGNESIWHPFFGYITRGTFAKNLGVPPWAFYMGKNKIGKAVPSAKPGSDVCNQFCGDPINTQNGNLYDEIELAKIPGQPELDFHISYNSQGAGASIFGENWTHSYNYHLVSMNNQFFTGTIVQYPGGRKVVFEGESLTPETGNFERLVKDGDKFKLELKDKTTIFFDEFGDVEKIEDSNENKLEFEYEDQVKGVNASKLTKIKADGDREIKIEYSNNLATKVILPEDKIVNLNYDDNNNLTKYIDAKGEEWKFEYDDHYRIIKKLSPKGRSIYTNEFDDQNRVVKQVAGKSFTQNFDYSENDNGSQTKVIDKNGKVAKYNYNKNGLLVSLVDENSKEVKYEYDSNAKVTKQADQRGNVSTYKYDDSGNQIEAKDALGKTVKREFNGFNKVTKEIDQNGSITTYEYDDKGNLVKITNPLNALATFEYNDEGLVTKSKDFNGYETKFKYDDSGNLTEIEDAKENKTKFEYDDLGRITKSIDANGNTTNYSHDQNDNLIRIVRPDNSEIKYEYDKNNHLIKEIDAKGGVTKYDYDESENLVKVTDQLGHVTKFEYGQMNERLAEIDPLNRVTNYLYTPSYEIKEIKNAALTPRESSQKFEFNNARIAQKEIDPRGNETRYEYDPLNRLIEVRNTINDSRKIEYDSIGNITKTVDENGNETTYEYDKLNRLIQIRNAKDEIQKFEYDANSNLTKEIDAKGNVTEYKYDQLNQLVEVKDAKGNSTRLEYDKVGNLIKKADREGNSETYEYDKLNRLVRTLNTENHSLVFEYDLNGNLVKEINARNFATTYTYDAANQLITIKDARGKEQKFEYDKVGNIVKATDKNGNAVSYNYDELNRLIKTQNAESIAQNYSYDKVGNLTAFIDARGNATSYEYDKLNRLVRTRDSENGTLLFEYDKMGNLLKETNPNGFAKKYEYDSVYRITAEINEENHKSTFAYDANDNLIKSIDRNGNATNYKYDELDNLVETLNTKHQTRKFEYNKESHLVKQTDENGNVINYELDALYRVVKITDAEGHTTKYEYDPNSNITKVIDGNSNSTSFEYDEVDRLVKTQNALSQIQKFAYDQENNLVNEIATDGVATRYNYDKAYRLSEVIQNYRDGISPEVSINVSTKYQYDPNNNLTKIINALGNETRFEYDELNRQIKEIDAEGNTWEYGYDADGNRNVRVDANGVRTEYEYFADNMLKGINYGDQQSAVSYQYDPNNNLVSMSDQLGTTTWEYDQLNRPVRTLNTENRTLKYEYDPVGNRTKLIYPDNRAVSYSYYKNNWLKSLTDPDSRVVSYHRDGVGNAIKTTNSNSTITETSYDKLNRISTIVNKSGSNTNSSLSYTYDKAGNRTKVQATYDWRKPSAITTDYSYDPLRRLTKSTDSEGVFNEYSYDAIGNRLTYKTNEKNSVTLSGVEGPFDEIRRDYTYNSINQISSIIEDGKSKKGNQKSKNDNAAQSLYALQHEILAQKGKKINDTNADDMLTKLNEIIISLESGVYDEQTVKDQILNLKTYTLNLQINEGTKNSLIVKIDKANSALNEETGDLVSTTFKYDRNGNRIEQRLPGKGNGSNELINYVYDTEDRLIEFTGLKNNQKVQMQYDGLGRRLRKSENNKSKEYLFDNLDVVGEYQGKQYTNFYRGDLNRIASSQHFPSGTDGQKFYYHYDALNSVVGLTKSNGKSDHNYRYSDFGSIEPSNGNFTEPHNSFTYTGQLYDSSMNLYEFYSRAYDPSTGVWLQQDRYRGEITNPNSLYRYQYVENSPVNYWDWYGFLSCKEGDMGPMTAEGYSEWRSTYCLKEDGKVPEVLIVESDIFASIASTIKSINDPESRTTVGSLCASMAFEPYDWYLTGKDVFSGNASRWDLLALAPLISKGMTSKIDEGLDLLKGGDEIGSALKSAEGLSLKIDVENLKFSDKVLQHNNDVNLSTGNLVRPYNNSILTIQEIMGATSPKLDPRKVEGFVRWDSPGSMNGSQGVFELVIDTNTNTVVHYLFKSTK